MAFSILTTLFLLFLAARRLSATPPTTTFNILDFGARPDGATDAGRPLLDAWSKACASNDAGAVVVPIGEFLLNRVQLSGPCNNDRLSVEIRGTILAPKYHGSALAWITFKRVDGLRISGGVLDGRGQALWDCKAAGKNCPHGAVSLTIDDSRNVWIDGLSSVNSESFHISIHRSNAVWVSNASVTAPANSPNTDGIHIEESSHVSVLGAAIATGDDCISLGPGATNVWIEHVSCGPGHGVSIGSLGAKAKQDGVRNVTARDVRFTATENGFRIKTWATASSSFVRDVVFEDGEMNDVKNPIIIDQNYCPHRVNCPNQSSGVQVKNVKFINVAGTSATEVAVRLDCSDSTPCSGIYLQDIWLRYNGNGEARTVCYSVHGGSSGVVVPPSCM